VYSLKHYHHTNFQCLILNDAYIVPTVGVHTSALLALLMVWN